MSRFETQGGLVAWYERDACGFRPYADTGRTTCPRCGAELDLTAAAAF